MKQVLILLICAGIAVAYNFEDRLPLYKVGEDGSLFGFSVTMHKTSDNMRDFVGQSALVIGSPRASALASQSNTVSPGGVYFCPVTTSRNDCTRILMDNGGSTYERNKTDQWLGVTVASQGIGGYLVTCAHRYSEREGSKDLERERVCGKCFLLDGSDSSNIREVDPEEARRLEFVASPCADLTGRNMYNKNKLAYTQAGTALTFSQDQYLLGGPGAYAWSGGMFGYRLATSPPVESEVPVLDEPGNDFATPGCKDDEFGPRSTKVKCDDIPVRRDSYMGFSVAVSHSMVANSDEAVYVVGAPTGDFTGAVILYTKRESASSTSLAFKDMIKGEQVGSSFGFSVAVLDLNGDGQDDLLVGAPQFYESSDTRKIGGRVYVYINSRIPRFSKIQPRKINGLPGSYFGHSLAPLGDIDQDGYDDFAVGSPYDQSGKVYIYRGDPNGDVKLSQTLDGKKFVKIPSQMRAFGISLSGNVDIDNNKYPDLLIGTLEDQAILFRTRPIISVYSSLNISKHVIDLATDCDYGRDGDSCFTLVVCFNYTARHSEYAAALGINYTIALDNDELAENKNSRVRFTSPQGSSIKTEATSIKRSDYQDCLDEEKIYFRPSSLDRLTPIDITFGLSLLSDDNVTETTEVLNLKEDPILDADLSRTKREQVYLLTDCGDDGCQSNLRVNGTVPPETVVEADSKINLRLNVTNDGEEAHQAAISIKLPPRVFYDSFNVSRSSGADISCLTREQGNSTFILCDLGNPYVTGSEDVIDIILDVSSIPVDTKEVVINVTSLTTSNNPKLNPRVLRSKVVFEMLLTLTGYGQPQQVRYYEAPIKGESAIFYRDEIGPLINYTFIVKNAGKQIANGINLIVNYPQEINNGKWLLYLVSTSVTVGGGRVAGKCSENYTNVLQIKPPSPEVRASRRSKRYASEEGNVSPLYKSERTATPYTIGAVRSTLKLNCADKTAQCVSVSCEIEPLQGGTSVSVFFQSRLWNATFLEEFKAVDLVHVGVFGNLVNKNANVRISGNQTSQTIETTVDHPFFEEDVISVFPWWYIVIAFILVLIIYIIIICLLRKFGFFKRKRYPVREPPPNEVTDKDALIEEEARHTEGRM